MPKAQAPAARAVFRQRLSDSRPLIAMAAIDGLGMLQDIEAMNAVLALRDNPSEWVRGAALAYMRSCAPAQAVPMALAALADAHFMVRETAIDHVDELGVAGQYLDRIRPLLDDEHPQVRSATAWAIEAAEEERRRGIIPHCIEHLSYLACTPPCCAPANDGREAQTLVCKPV